MGRYEFLVETYRTERLKTLDVWAQIPDSQMRFRPEPRARSPLEHMIHQCISEENWMHNMLGLAISCPPLPADESRRAFINHYETCSTERFEALAAKSDDWFERTTRFFDVDR